MQLGYVAGIENDEQLLVALLDGEIRDNRFLLRLVHRTGESVRRFLIEPHNLLYGSLELLFRAIQTLNNFLEMMFGEGLEMIA